MKHNFFITAIVSAFMLSASFAAHAAQSWIVTDTAPGSGEPVTAVEGVTFTPYGIGGVTGIFSSNNPATLPDGTEVLSGYDSWAQCKVEGMTPNGGNYYKFEVSAPGRLSVALRTANNKYFVVSSNDTLITSIEFSEEYEPEFTDEGFYFSGRHSGTVAWDVEAGKTYYVYCPESAVQLGGFHFAGVNDVVYTKLTVDVATPGTFAQTFLGITDKKWNITKDMAVAGELNEEDLKSIKNVKYLRDLDLSGASFTTLPSGFLNQHKYVRNVTFPALLDSISTESFYYCPRIMSVMGPNIKIVGQSAFYGCEKLKNVNLENAEKIYSNAFSSCSRLQTVNLKSVEMMGSGVFYGCDEMSIADGDLNALTLMGNSAFERCRALSGVSMASLEEVPQSAFRYCENLRSVTLSSSVRRIGYNAFTHCATLRELTLPSSLMFVEDNVFGYSGIRDLRCLAVCPPRLNNYSSLFGSNANADSLALVTLRVPAFAIDSYRNANGWKEIYVMEAADIPSDKILVHTPLEINTDNIDGVFTDFPDVSLIYGSESTGSLTFTGTSPFNVGKLDISCRIPDRKWYNTECYPTLLNRSADMSVQCASLKFLFNIDNSWCFVSLPFDVKISDIIVPDDLEWVIREYDGALRANGEPAWKNLSSTDVLKGGRGYIVAVNLANYYSDSDRTMTFVSTSSNVSNLVRHDNAAVALEEHVGEFTHNRSWNLIGNPYQAFYRIADLAPGFSAPVTVWDGDRYAAHSPLDDDYVLAPNEAFFVQRPQDTDHILFSSEKRCTTREDAESEDYNFGSRASMSELREVFDFNISCKERTRVVLNDAARADYEVGRDASKFFANNGTELYVIGSGASYAIDERPAADCKAILGIRSSEAATHTLTLSGRHSSDWEVEVTDLKSGVTATLGAAGLDFSTEAGEAGARFEVRFKNPAYSGIVDAVMPEDGSVKVYTVDGILLHEGTLDTFAAPAKGLYIVKGSRKASKVFIK